MSLRQHRLRLTLCHVTRCVAIMWRFTYITCTYNLSIWCIDKTQPIWIHNYIPGSLSTNRESLWSQHGYVIECPVKWGMKLLIHSQTSAVQPFVYLTFHNGCRYLSMPRLQLTHVRKKGLGRSSSVWGLMQLAQRVHTCDHIVSPVPSNRLVTCDISKRIFKSFFVNSFSFIVFFHSSVKYIRKCLTDALIRSISYLLTYDNYCSNKMKIDVDALSHKSILTVPVLSAIDVTPKDIDKIYQYRTTTNTMCHELFN